MRFCAIYPSTQLEKKRHVDAHGHLHVKDHLVGLRWKATTHEWRTAAEKRLKNHETQVVAWKRSHSGRWQMEMEMVSHADKCAEVI